MSATAHDQPQPGAWHHTLPRTQQAHYGLLNQVALDAMSVDPTAPRISIIVRVEEGAAGPQPGRANPSAGYNLPLQVPADASVDELRYLLFAVSRREYLPKTQLLRVASTGEALRPWRPLAHYGIADGHVLSLQYQEAAAEQRGEQPAAPAAGAVPAAAVPQSQAAGVPPAWVALLLPQPEAPLPAAALAAPALAAEATPAGAAPAAAEQEENEEEEAPPALQQPPAAAAAASPRRRGRAPRQFVNHKWSLDEVRMLATGFQELGRRWSDIRLRYFVWLQARDEVACKDKWRILEKQVSSGWRDQRPPLPQDLRDLITRAHNAHAPAHAQLPPPATPQSGRREGGAGEEEQDEEVDEVEEADDGAGPAEARPAAAGADGAVGLSRQRQRRQDPPAEAEAQPALAIA